MFHANGMRLALARTRFEIDLPIAPFGAYIAQHPRGACGVVFLRRSKSDNDRNIVRAHPVCAMGGLSRYRRRTAQ